jgi:hypothetical protein
LLPANGGEPAARNLERLREAEWLARLTDGELSRLGDFNAAPLDAGEFSKVLSGFSMALTEAGGGALAVELDKLIGWVQAPYARAELVSMHFSLVSLRRFLVDAWIEDQHQWFDQASEHGRRQQT